MATVLVTGTVNGCGSRGKLAFTKLVASRYDSRGESCRKYY